MVRSANAKHRAVYMLLVMTIVILGLRGAFGASFDGPEVRVCSDPSAGRPVRLCYSLVIVACDNCTLDSGTINFVLDLGDGAVQKISIPFEYADITVQNNFHVVLGEVYHTYQRSGRYSIKVMYLQSPSHYCTAYIHPGSVTCMDATDFAEPWWQTWYPLGVEIYVTDS